MSAHITVVGNVGNDPVLEGEGDTERLKIRVASNWTRKVGGQWEKQEAIWFSVTMWGNRARRLADYIRKGTPVTVIGEFGIREYTRGDGTTGIDYELYRPEICLQGGRRDDGQRDSGRTKHTTRPAHDPDFSQGGGFSDADVPF